MTSAVRVGIVGLGGMGGNHARNIDGLGHEVVAGADVVAEAREAFAERLDAETYEEYGEMIADADLDAVVVTTPNAFHAPASVEALEAGLDVLCEKPLADSLANAERMHEAATDADGFLMVGFHNRFSTAAELLTRKREAGRLGSIEHVEANMIRRRGIPGVNSWFTSKELSGGGALIDIGVHAIDFALYLAGYPDVEEVSATTRATFGTEADYADPDNWGDNWAADDATFDVDDSASAFLRCADGTTISLEVAWATNRPPDDTFYVRGTEAGAELSLGGDDLTLYGVGTEGTDHYVDTALEGSLDPAGHEAEDAAFLEAVAAGEPPTMNTVDEGLTVQRVIDAIYRSDETGGAVSL